MKNNKWIRVTLTILLSLIVLAGVAGVSFRLGTMQNAPLLGSREVTAHRFQSFGNMQGFEHNFNNQRNDQRMMQGFEHGGFGRGRSIGFFSPLFGLIKLAVLSAFLWLGFKFVKNSGWRITRETAQPAPAPAAGSETPSVEVEEKKE